MVFYKGSIAHIINLIINSINSKAVDRIICEYTINEQNRNYSVSTLWSEIVLY